MKHKIIFKAIIGSQAQGLATETSDVDYQGVYIQDSDDLLSFDYEPFYRPNKDETYYEIRRFIELLMESNPNALELLFSPDDMIIQTSPQFDLLRENKHKFLSKECVKTFVGYANTQIKKSKGLNKKINFEISEMIRKEPIDFCYIYKNGKSIPAMKFFNDNFIDDNKCGLVNLNNMKSCFALYPDRENNKNYRGVFSEKGSEVRTSSILKEDSENENYLMYYNLDAYSSHCKTYNSYIKWISERNVERFKLNKEHGQNYDSKHIMHLRRLLDIAYEIGTTGTFSVKRPNRDYLLSIKKGEAPLEEIIRQSKLDSDNLEKVFENSGLQETVNKEFAKEILLKIRKTI